MTDLTPTTEIRVIAPDGHCYRVGTAALIAQWIAHAGGPAAVPEHTFETPDGSRLSPGFFLHLVRGT